METAFHDGVLNTDNLIYKLIASLLITRLKSDAVYTILHLPRASANLCDKITATLCILLRLSNTVHR